MRRLWSHLQLKVQTPVGHTFLITVVIQPINNKGRRLVTRDALLMKLNQDLEREQVSHY